MAANYIVRAPQNAVHNGDHPCMDTANVDLSSVDWDVAVDPAANGGAGDVYRCPRGFVPKADGVLAVKAAQDSAVTNIYVLAGVQYAIAIKHIDQSACAAALQIADAVALLY